MSRSNTMRGRKDRYDRELLDAFVKLKGDDAARLAIKELPLKSVCVGMVFLDDVKTTTVSSWSLAASR